MINGLGSKWWVAWNFSTERHIALRSSRGVCGWSAQIFLFDVITTLDDHKSIYFCPEHRKNGMPFSRNYIILLKAELISLFINRCDKIAVPTRLTFQVWFTSWGLQNSIFRALVFKRWFRMHTGLDWTSCELRINQTKNWKNSIYGTKTCVSLHKKVYKMCNTA